MKPVILDSKYSYAQTSNVTAWYYSHINPASGLRDEHNPSFVVYDPILTAMFKPNDRQGT